MALADVLLSIQNKLSFKKKVEILGINFELGLLSFEQELRPELTPQEDMDPIVYYNQTRLQTLSYAIRSINGEQIPEVVEIAVGGKVEKKQKSLFIKEFISSLPTKVAEQLFEIYIDLKEEVEADLDKQLKYTWFKTPEEREEDRKRKKEESKEKASEDETSENIKFTPIPEPPEEEKPAV